MNNDQVRFFRPTSYRELGEWETMIKELKELIDKYPKSDWAIEARLILGDYYFDKGEIAEAEALLHGDHRAAREPPARHGALQARPGSASTRRSSRRRCSSSKTAVTSKRKAKQGAIGDARRLDVKREAIVAMVWPFSEVRKVQQAIAVLPRPRRLEDPLRRRCSTSSPTATSSRPTT